MSLVFLLCSLMFNCFIFGSVGVPLNSIGRRPWPATSTLPQRWIDDSQKQKLVELMQAQ